MSKIAIFISTKGDKLENIGRILDEEVDFWAGYNEGNSTDQKPRKIYSKVLLGNGDEYYLYGIQCHTIPRDPETPNHYPNHYVDSGEKYVNAINTYLNKNSEFDKVLLLLHEKDVNSANFLTNEFENKGHFCASSIDCMWLVTNIGKTRYGLTNGKSEMLLFQHEPGELMMQFLCEPIDISKIYWLRDVFQNYNVFNNEFEL